MTLLRLWRTRIAAIQLSAIGTSKRLLGLLVVIKLRQCDPRQPLGDRPLNHPQIAFLVGRDKRKRIAGGAGSPGAPDAVNVVFGQMRAIKINNGVLKRPEYRCRAPRSSVATSTRYCPDLSSVEPYCRSACDWRCGCRESCQTALIELPENPRKPIRPMFGARKANHALQFVIFKQLNKQRSL